MAAPKELLRRGLLIGTEKLQGQLRDAAQGGQREDTEADRTQDAARTVTQRVVYRLEKLVRGRRKGRSRTFDGTWEEPVAEPHETRSEYPTPTARTESPASPSSTEPVRIKTKAAYVHRQAPGLETPHQQHIADNDAALSEPSHSTHQFTQHQVKTKDTCVHRQTYRQRPSMETPRQQYTTSGDTAPIDSPRADHPSSQPLEQGRQKFIREQKNKATARQVESQRRLGQAAPARQQD